MKRNIAKRRPERVQRLPDKHCQINRVKLQDEILGTSMHALEHILHMPGSVQYCLDIS
ncbi:hypothetical protein D3C80_1693980 [compost metagenome]